MSKLCGYNCEYNKDGWCQISACIKKSRTATHTEIVDEIVDRNNEPGTHLIKDIEALIQANNSLKERVAYLEQNNGYKEKWVELKNFLTRLLEIYEESDGGCAKSEYDYGIMSGYGVILHEMGILDGEEI